MIGDMFLVSVDGLRKTVYDTSHPTDYWTADPPDKYLSSATLKRCWPNASDEVIDRSVSHHGRIDGRQIYAKDLLTVRDKNIIYDRLRDKPCGEYLVARNWDRVGFGIEYRITKDDGYIFAESAWPVCYLPRYWWPGGLADINKGHLAKHLLVMKYYNAGVISKANGGRFVFIKKQGEWSLTASGRRRLRYIRKREEVWQELSHEMPELDFSQEDREAARRAALQYYEKFREWISAMPMDYDLATIKDVIFHDNDQPPLIL